METNVKIPFAEQNGKIVHISQVENGLSCNCICCKCGAQLVAKNNVSNIKEAHFAHYNSDDCGKSLETSIHKAAKQLLSETKKIVVPDILYYDKSNEITFERVELEKIIQYEKQHIKVDALGYVNNIHKIIVEFAVTHSSSEKKKQIFNKLKIPAIEVSLHRLCLSFDDIGKVLQENGQKEWLYYPLQSRMEFKSFFKKCREEIESLNNTISSLKESNHSLENNYLSALTEIHNLKKALRQIDKQFLDSLLQKQKHK